jgi:hypothetical protein
MTSRSLGMSTAALSEKQACQGALPNRHTNADFLAWGANSSFKFSRKVQESVMFPYGNSIDIHRPRGLQGRP